MSALNSFVLLITALAAACSCVLAQAGTEPPFDYSGSMGPDHWGEHYNQCAGKHQSPININDINVMDFTFKKIDYNNFNETPAMASIMNNGHTVVMKMEFVEDIPTISGGPLAGKGVYQFHQLHFHWGENNTVGSEDQINNVSYPMELHVVFRNKKYSNFSTAVKKFDGLAVLAAFFEVGNFTSGEYEDLTSQLQYVSDAGSNISFSVPMDLWSLLPENPNGYYTYVGSLTTPPCNEDVMWIDFIHPITITPEAMERFRLLKTFDGRSLIHNFRPVQPINNRKIYKSDSHDVVNNLDNRISSPTSLMHSNSAFITPSAFITVISALILIINFHLF